MERVVVTGLGVVSCLGPDLESYWRALLRAESTPSDVPDPNANMDVRLMYYVHEWDRLERSAAGDRLGRASGFALRASDMALRDAGLERVPEGAGVMVGTGMGDADLFDAERAGGEHVGGRDAFTFKVSSAVAAHLGATGPNLSVSTACSASAYSVSLAADAIRSGWADVVVAGGSDGYSRVGVACFNRLGALDPVVCRPFDVKRAGTVFGEGAAIMVLESESHARARGRDRFYAEVEGAGWSCEGHHATAPEPSGELVIAAMKAAFDEAGIEPSDVGCVVPHGTGTELNDLVESDALVKVFGDDVRSLPVCNLKAMLGHTGGAAGAFSCLTGALVVDRGVVPPNANAGEVDPRCPLELHTGEPLERDVGHVLVNAYAFGGNNISVVLGRGRDG